MTLHRKYPHAVAIAAVTGLAVAPALALAFGDDRVELFASESVTTDDNVFRLSDKLDPESVTGEPARDDRYFTTEFGINLDLPLSRQRVVGNVTVERSRFDRFTSLDLDGHSGFIRWDWLVGNRLTGRLGYSESLTLASLANVLGGEQNNTANFLTISETIGSARYKLTERWYLSGGLSKLRNENSAENNRISDLRMNRGEFGVSYVTRGGTEFGISNIVSDAELPNRQSLGQQLVDNSYRQRETAAMIDWRVTADSRLRLRVGRVNREHDELPERDYSGGIHEIEYNWQPTDKLSLAAISMRGISPYDQVNVGFVLLDSLTLRSNWRATEKFSLTLSAIDGDRTYLGDPRLALTPVAPRTENVQFLELDLHYQATDVITLSLELRDAGRTSSAQFGDYDARILGFTVRAGF